MAATATSIETAGAKSFGGERLKEALVGYSFIAIPKRWSCRSSW